MSDEIGSNNNLVEYVVLNVELIANTLRFSANDPLADLGDFADVICLISIICERIKFTISNFIGDKILAP